MSPAEIDFMREGACPLCGHGTLLEGACATMCMNVKCDTCGSVLNVMGPFGVTILQDYSPNVQAEA